MQRTILVAVREFRQRIRQRGFWFSTLGMPLMILVIWGATGMLGGGTGVLQNVPLLSEPPDQAVQTVEYVDQANLIRRIPESVPADLFTAYPDVAAADAALLSGKIDAYYIIAADYPQTGNVQRVSRQLPTSPADIAQLNQVLLNNLFPDMSDQELAQVRSPFHGELDYVTLTPQGETGAEGNSMLPFLVAFVVMIPLFTSGGYLFQSLVKEKESRVLEILLMSLKPHQLLTGKLLGLGTLALVQYLSWMALTAIVLVVTGGELSQLLGGISLTLNEIVLIIPFALGGFALYAGLMAGIGALAPDMESSRMWTFVITLPSMIPIYLASAIALAPNGPLAVILSLFPFSAPVSMLIRMTSTAVPTWQILLSLALLTAGAAAVIWLMARLFRAQTLLSGERLSVGRFISALIGT